MPTISSAASRIAIRVASRCSPVRGVVISQGVEKKSDECEMESGDRRLWELKMPLGDGASLIGKFMSCGRSSGGAEEVGEELVELSTCLGFFMVMVVNKECLVGVVILQKNRGSNFL